jgi:tRNA pseudouridine38-40 synthase
MAVVEAVEVPLGFDVIGAVKSKLYRYTIYTGPVRPVLQIRRCWHIPAKLDIAAMAAAAKLLVGTKDFKSFAAGDEKRVDTVRTIFRCDVTDENDWVSVDVEGDSFLYNMVRNIVGTLVEVGVGRWNPEKINEILEARDRTAAGPLAPAAGLCLIWVKY